MIQVFFEGLAGNYFQNLGVLQIAFRSEVNYFFSIIYHKQIQHQVSSRLTWETCMHIPTYSNGQNDFHLKVASCRRLWQPFKVRRDFCSLVWKFICDITSNFHSSHRTLTYRVHLLYGRSEEYNCTRKSIYKQVPFLAFADSWIGLSWRTSISKKFMRIG